jgi:N-ethylmaleimide reductase
MAPESSRPAAARLFQPVKVRALELPNRIVMVPMTRNRADPQDAPHDLNAEYYRQRATAGLIITEASQVSPQGKGYPRTPGIYSDAQVNG